MANSPERGNKGANLPPIKREGNGAPGGGGKTKGKKMILPDGLNELAAPGGSFEQVGRRHFKEIFMETSTGDVMIMLDMNGNVRQYDALDLKGGAKQGDSRNHGPCLRIHSSICDTHFPGFLRQLRMKFKVLPLLVEDKSPYLGTRKDGNKRSSFFMNKLLNSFALWKGNLNPNNVPVVPPRGDMGHFVCNTTKMWLKKNGLKRIADQIEANSFSTDRYTRIVEAPYVGGASTVIGKTCGMIETAKLGSHQIRDHCRVAERYACDEPAERMIELIRFVYYGEVDFFMMVPSTAEARHNLFENILGLLFLSSKLSIDDLFHICLRWIPAKCRAVCGDVALAETFFRVGYYINLGNHGNQMPSAQSSLDQCKLPGAPPADGLEVPFFRPYGNDSDSCSGEIGGHGFGRTHGQS